MSRYETYGASMAQFQFQIHVWWLSGVHVGEERVWAGCLDPFIFTDPSKKRQDRPHQRASDCGIAAVDHCQPLRMH